MRGVDTDTERVYRGLDEICTRLGVSRPTAIKYLKGRLIAHSMTFNVYRVTESAVQDFERRHTFEAVVR